jgi:hypothetical protein
MSKVFKKKDKKPNPSFSVAVALNNKATKGTIGLEIEVEGSRLLVEDNTPEPWAYHEDGSLRGKQNAEYVLIRPIEFSAVPKALEILWTALEKNKAVLDDSNRTSVHVHLNCQEFHMNRLASLMALWFTFEEILTEWCGEHRVGNLFALRAKDAPAVVSQFKKFIRTDGEYKIGDPMRYAALNGNALHKFGSLEIRTLRGTSDKSVIQTWVDICERLYTLSAAYPDPRDICGLFSSGGPINFFDTILGPYAAVIRKEVPWNEEQIKDSMYEGIRFAQDICYCRDWDMFKAMELKPDPFNRDSRRMIKRIYGTSIPLVDGAEAFAPDELQMAVQTLGLNAGTSPSPVYWSQPPQEEYPFPDNPNF